MTNLELIEQHRKDTIYHSFHHTMKSSSTTYKEIIAKGDGIIPDILKYLKDNPKTAGMSIMMLLWDITKESPYQPEEIKNNKGEKIPHFSGFNVPEATKAWIKWGEKKNLI